MNFFRYIREAIWLFRREQLWHRRSAPILVLNLRDYTYEECLLAAGRCKKIEHEQVGVIANLLFCRAGRGTATIEDALSCYVSS